MPGGIPVGPGFHRLDSNACLSQTPRHPDSLLVDWPDTRFPSQGGSAQARSEGCAAGAPLLSHRLHQDSRGVGLAMTRLLCNRTVLVLFLLSERRVVFTFKCVIPRASCVAGRPARFLRLIQFAVSSPGLADAANPHPILTGPERCNGKGVTTESGTSPCQGPPKFIFFGSCSAAFRVTPFRLPLSGPVRYPAAVRATAYPCRHQFQRAL